MTVAILGIMVGLVVSAFSNAATDTNRVVSRQQQAALQAAVNAWINGDGNRVALLDSTTGHSKPRTVEEIRNYYNYGSYTSTSGAITTLARLNLVANYLDDTTKNYFFAATTNSNKIKSSALTQSKQYLSLPDWAAASYPQVSLIAE